jgi:AAA15 family ATPase/GTPase
MSFKGVAKIDFQAATIKEHKENIFSPSFKTDYTFLKSIGIFGNNNSGKSNLIKAASFMRDFVLSSSKESNSSQPIRIQPFLLSTDTQSSPSTFEMVFILDTIKYRYGFSVSKSSVHSEWLFVTEKRKENKLFIRANTDYTFEKKFKEGLRGHSPKFTILIRAGTIQQPVMRQYLQMVR